MTPVAPAKHKEVALADLTRRHAYKIVVGTVIPRPIAWVTSQSGDGVVNLAPFSFFTALGYRPATFGFAVSDTDLGEVKDTLRNIRHSKEFVINIAGSEFAAEVHGSGARYSYGVSEADELGIALLPSSTITPPRVAGVPIAFECRLTTVLPIPGDSHWVVGEALIAHVREDVVDDELSVDFEALRPLGRLIGDAYLVRGDVAHY